jgi:hypothetical protein
MRRLCAGGWRGVGDTDGRSAPPVMMRHPAPGAAVSPDSPDNPGSAGNGNRTEAPLTW